MPTGNAKFEAAANEAGCQFLLAAGAAATQFTAYSLLTGSLVTGAAGAAVVGIAAYAYAQNCQWDTTAGSYPTDVQLPCCPPNDDTGDKTKWWKYRIYRISQDRWIETDIGYSFDNSGRYDRGWIDFPGAPGDDGAWNLNSCGSPSYTTRGFIPSNLFGSDYKDHHIVPPTGTGCDVPAPQPPGPYTYTDPDDGCQIQVTFQGWAVDGGGSFGPVWQMDPILPSTRASGSIIGGCNFSPVIYYQPPGGPPVPPIPVPPSPTPGPGGEPWWVSLLMGALGGVAAAAADQVLEKLFEDLLPAGNRTIRAACEYKENGDPETYTVNFPEESWADRVITAIDAGIDFQQQILLWKTPTCSGGGSSVSGQPVTITWSSDEPSPASGDRVRKIFTYFDQSGSSQLDHVNWWKDFSWQAGPVIVSCVGTALGRPQVWAASLDEAKRVIQHAATIAQVDLTKAEWMVAPPKSTRYGLPGTMRVHRSQDGGFWVTKRDGPDGAPIVLS